MIKPMTLTSESMMFLAKEYRECGGTRFEYVSSVLQ